MIVNITADVLPGDIFFVDPFAAEIREDLRDRSSEIMDMAVSFHIHGQRRAVECLQIDDDHLLVEHGRIRTAAAQLICSGFQYTDPETNTEVKVKVKKFKLKVIITNAIEVRSSE